MVLFFTSTATDSPVTLYMGRDKFENEDLIKYAWPQDIWFHVDKLSSAHVYLRLPETMAWDNIPEAALTDCAQLVKANSIEGNKKDNLTIIYTPADNLKKTGDMDVGQVSFHNDKRVRIAFKLTPIQVHIANRENAIVNRLNKTKVEREVNHEQERVDRLKKENAKKRATAAEKRKAELELAHAREAEKAARSYDLLFTGEEEEPDSQRSVREMEDDFM
ncbi:cytoplasmic protein [Amanita muscaria]